MENIRKELRQLTERQTVLNLRILGEIYKSIFGSGESKRGSLK